MQTARLEKQGAILIGRVEQATRLADRLVGLLGRHGLPPGHAMHIVPCPAIHTFMMKFTLDLIFLARDMTVTRIVRNVQPGRMVGGGQSTHSVIEFETGWFAWNTVAVGDKLTLAPLTDNGRKAEEDHRP